MHPRCVMMLRRCMMADRARSFALTPRPKLPLSQLIFIHFGELNACTSDAYQSVGICPVGEFPMSSEQGSLLPRSMGITSARVGRRGVISTLL
jgi:hypothetical protein